MYCPPPSDSKLILGQHTFWTTRRPVEDFTEEKVRSGHVLNRKRDKWSSLGTMQLILNAILYFKEF